MQNYLIGVGFLVCAVFALIDWRGVIEHYFGNDASKGKIYLESGGEVEILKAKRVYIGDDGQLYLFKMCGESLAVGVKRNYPYKYNRGRRMIWLREGEAEASVWYEDEKETVGSMDLGMLVLGKFAHDFGAAFTGKSGFNMKWFLLLVIIVVVAYVGFQMFGKSQGVEIPPVSPVPSGDNVPLGFLLRNWMVI